MKIIHPVISICSLLTQLSLLIFLQWFFQGSSQISQADVNSSLVGDGWK